MMILFLFTLSLYPIEQLISLHPDTCGANEVNDYSIGCNCEMMPAALTPMFMAWRVPLTPTGTLVAGMVFSMVSNI